MASAVASAQTSALLRAKKRGAAPRCVFALTRCGLDGEQRRCVKMAAGYRRTTFVFALIVFGDAREEKTIASDLKKKTKIVACLLSAGAPKECRWKSANTQQDVNRSSLPAFKSERHSRAETTTKTARDKRDNFQRQRIGF